MLTVKRREVVSETCKIIYNAILFKKDVGVKI